MAHAEVSIRIGSQPKAADMREVVIHDKTFRIMIEAEKIQQRVHDIARQINKDYDGRIPLFLGVLNGAFLFTADLFKGIDLMCEISFVRVKSYSGTASSGEIKSLIGLKEDIAGRDVIIVEDIVDTGVTAKYLLEELRSKNPASVKLATMIFKPAALQHPVTPDYIGFEIEPHFIVGYGLDYDGLGRNLNDIYVLK